MKSRNLKWPLGTCALLLSQFAVAIGLGEIRPDSAMDERFKAELELLNIGDLDENQMVVGLAPAADFENAGVERDFQLADLQFRVDLSNQSRPVVRISSRRPIREPYLNFLVELRWPSGRLLREYTVLLDLPTFAGAAQPGTGAAQPGKSLAATSAVAADSQASSTPTSTAASTPRPRASGTQAPAPGRVQVRGGDTLWGLAERYQASGATIPQTMMAIAEANPDAFINGDLNLIRRGAWLEIPDAQNIRSVDRAAALTKLQETTAAPPVVESRPATAAAQATDGSEGELHLTAAGGTAGGGSAAGTAPDSDTTTGSEPGLAAVLEERDRLQRENVELQDRIQSLEAQLSTVTRLVELDDPTLAALQQQTQAAAPPQGAQPGAETRVAETSVAETADGAAGEQVAPAPRPSAQADAAGAETDQEESAAAAAPAPAQAPEPAADPTEPGGADGSRPLAAMARLGEWLIPALGAGAVLLLGLLIWATLRRGSGVQQQGLELPSEVEGDSRGSNRAAAPGAAEIGDDELFAAPADSEGPEDILNEADVCLSFGHDEQAEELLREALDDYPDEPRLHLKLLEVLAARDDRDAFEVQLPQLAALGDLDAFAAAEALQRWDRGPEADGSAPEAAQGVTEAAEIPLEDFDLDLDLDIPAAPGAPPERQPFQTGVAANSEAELEDFDLGLEAAPEAEPETAAAPRPAVASDTLEDLELFEPGQELATQLELAQAYVEMGDAEGAREILDYVVESGDESQQEAARELLARLG